MAVNTKEICRRVNGNVSRDFCHSVNIVSCKTAKSYSDKRGCAMVPYDHGKSICGSGNKFEPIVSEIKALPNCFTCKKCLRKLELQDRGKE